MRLLECSPFGDNSGQAFTQWLSVRSSSKSSTSCQGEPSAEDYVRTASTDKRYVCRATQVANLPAWRIKSVEDLHGRTMLESGVGKGTVKWESTASNQTASLRSGSFRLDLNSSSLASSPPRVKYIQDRCLTALNAAYPTWRALFPSPREE